MSPSLWRMRIRLRWALLRATGRVPRFGLPHPFRDFPPAAVLDGLGWIADEKLDGIPVQVAVRRGSVRIAPLERGMRGELALPRLAALLRRRAPDGSLLVGELWHPAGAGRLGRSLRSGRVPAGARLAPFDALAWSGRLLLGEPFHARRARLEKAFGTGGPVAPPRRSGMEGSRVFFARVIRRGGEGVVRRRRDALIGDPAWRLKAVPTFELVVQGVHAEAGGKVALSVGTGDKFVGIAVVERGDDGTWLGCRKPEGLRGAVVEVEPRIMSPTHRPLPLFRARRVRPHKRLASRLPWPFHGVAFGDDADRLREKLIATARAR